MLTRLAALLASLALLIAFVGCGDDKQKSDTQADSTSESTTTSSTPPAGDEIASTDCNPGPSDDPVKPPTKLLPEGKDYTAKIKTTFGTITIKLDNEHSPKTATSFAYLANKDFYNGLDWTRVAQDFVIQGGDPLNNGTGGPGYCVVEPPPSDTVYSVGTVAMAKSGNDPAGTSGSQFFVVTGEQALPPDYALLGEVKSGQSVADKIGRLKTDPPGDGAPVRTVKINSVTIDES